MTTAPKTERDPLRAAVRFAGFWKAAVVPVVAVAVLLVVASTAGAAEQETARPSGDVKSGERIFRTHCAMCHGADGTGMMGMHPSLRGAVTRLSREGVEVTIRQGRRTEPPMPAFESRLSEQEIDDVIAYITALPDGPRNFGPGEDGGMMDGGMMGDGMMGVAAMAVLAVLAVAGIAAVVLVVRRTANSPRRVLDRRYAAGELSRDEYVQARHDLNGDDPG